MEKEPEGYEFVTIGLMWQLFGQILLQHSYTVSSPGNKRAIQIHRALFSECPPEDLSFFPDPLFPVHSDKMVLLHSIL